MTDARDHEQHGDAGQQPPAGAPPYGQAPYGQQAPGQSPYEQPASEQAPDGQAPYGQAPDRHAPHGQAPDEQSPYGQPASGQAPSGQAPYGQAPYGQVPYGQAPYDQAPYGQSPYGQPAYGQPEQPWAAQSAGLPPGVSPRLADGRVPLWAPLYDAGLVESVKRYVRKYADFTGRASRSEYWWVALASTVVYLGLGLVGAIAGIPGATVHADGSSDPGPGFFPFTILLALLFFATIVPNLSLGARRLHDVGLSGWLLLLVIVPYLGSLSLFVLSLLGPKAGGAEYDRPRP